MSQRSLQQYTQHQRRAGFEEMCQRLELELRIECPITPRRHLDVYLRAAALELDGILATVDGFKDRGRVRLAALRRQVENRGVFPGVRAQTGPGAN